MENTKGPSPPTPTHTQQECGRGVELRCTACQPLTAPTFKIGYHSHAWCAGHTCGLAHISSSGLHKGSILTLLCDLVEGLVLGSLKLLEVADNQHVCALLGGLQVILGFEGGSSRTALLLDPADNAISVTTGTVTMLSTMSSTLTLHSPPLDNYDTTYHSSCMTQRHMYMTCHCPSR